MKGLPEATAELRLKVVCCRRHYPQKLSRILEKTLQSEKKADACIVVKKSLSIKPIEIDKLEKFLSFKPSSETKENLKLLRRETDTVLKALDIANKNRWSKIIEQK